MGRYTTNMISDKDYKELIETIREGYTDDHGHKHYPNDQIATILVLEANLGCRIGDIMELRTNSIIREGEVWKLNITEQKTGKPRYFIVPQPVKDFIDAYAERNHIFFGKLFDIAAPAVWKCLRQVTDYLGIERCSTHSFRKKCASDLYEATNYDIEAVASFLNHASINTTRRYIKRSDKQMESAINSIVNLA